jgi:REase_MTES_1575
MLKNNDADLRVLKVDDDYDPELHWEYVEGGPSWSPLGPALEKISKKSRAAIEIGVQCESPIEVQLAAELIIYPPFSTGKAVLLPQRWLGGFRYDFAVRLVNESEPTLYIECDGLEFHSTTEQQKNDRNKDQAVIASGAYILRFTGSEIHRHPEKCAAYIRKVLGLPPIA